MTTVTTSAAVAKKAKEVNYTEAQTAEIVAAYKAEPTKGTVEALATKFGKTTRSIVAKLSRERVYQKEGYKTKAGDEVVSKADLVEGIAAILSVPSETIGDLEKANKTTLQLLSNALGVVADLNAVAAENQGDDEAELQRQDGDITDGETA